MTELSENTLLEGVALTAAVSKLDGWEVADGKLQASFTFTDFGCAMAFMMRVAFDAERLCHHPNWSNVYNRVQVQLSSHDLGGISQLCVELAGCMNRAASERGA